MNESDLRSRFQQLRDADRRATPSFAALAGAPLRPRRWLLPMLAAASLILVIGLVMLTHRRERASLRAAAPPITTWRAPTDVLLTTSGSELLRTVPSFGPTPDRGRKGNT